MTSVAILSRGYKTCHEFVRTVSCLVAMQHVYSACVILTWQFIGGRNRFQSSNTLSVEKLISVVCFHPVGVTYLHVLLPTINSELTLEKALNSHTLIHFIYSIHFIIIIICSSFFNIKSDFIQRLLLVSLRQKN